MILEAENSIELSEKASSVVQFWPEKKSKNLVVEIQSESVQEQMS